MIGYIDLIDERPAMEIPGMTPEIAALSPKRRVVVDTKTGSKKWSKAALANNAQLTLYAHIEGVPDVRVDQLMTLTKGPVYVPGESTRTQAQIEIVVEHINEVANHIRAGVFPKTSVDNWACNEKHCSHWLMCRGKKA
jgi:hypothetical protein